MEISIDVRKSVGSNAAHYFEAAKKARKKREGAEKALSLTEGKLGMLQEKKSLESREIKETRQREKKWFEKFRWFVSSEGFLCVGGRDATSNEVLVKKHVEKGDVVFHTQLQGSPFFVVKTEGKRPGKQTLEEAAIAVASFSRAWRIGLSHAEVFYVRPDQLSKSAKAGEYVEKGAFIILGKVNRMTAELKLAVGITKEGSVMCGPVSAVRKNCGEIVEIGRGSDKPSSVAKGIGKRLGGSIDEIVRALPSGGVRLPP